MGIWKDINELVYQDLNNHGALTTLLSKGSEGIHQLIADPDEGSDFITYDAQYQGNPSKDGKYNFTISIRVFASTHKKAVVIADEVIEAIKLSDNSYTVISGKPAFTEQNEFYLEQIFNIKK